MNDADRKAMNEAWRSKTAGLNYCDFEEGWQAACKWRDSQVGEPVAFTNAYQLEYLKNPKYSATPMAMWAKPFNEAAIALYLRPPPRKSISKCLKR